MGNIIARPDVKSVQMEAVIIRADGSREDLGVIAEWYKNPLRRWYAAIKKELPTWLPSL